MHADQLPTDLALVRRLVDAQFPPGRAEPLVPLASGGTANALFRLGDTWLVRIPLRPAAKAEQIDKECHWLPRLAPHLPVQIPTPVHRGDPAFGYPVPWTIYAWIEGIAPGPHDLLGATDVAKDLAAFLGAFWAIDLPGGPAPGEHNFWRGAPLIDRDASVRAGLGACADEIDADAALAMWEAGLAAETPGAAGCWIHGDVKGDNLLLREGRLAAVIDFGGLGVGDRAYDLSIAWTAFGPQARRVFLDAIQPPDRVATRARAIAASIAAVALPYYRDTNPAMAAMARFTFGQLDVLQGRA